MANADKTNGDDCIDRGRGDSMYFQEGLGNEVTADSEDEEEAKGLWLGVGVGPTGMIALEAESMFKAVDADILPLVSAGN